MALELPSIQALASLWAWAKDNIALWCQAVGSLKEVVSRFDPAENAALLEAIQFSFFSIFLSVLIALPYNFVWAGRKYGAADAIIDCILNFVLIVIIAVSQKIASIIVRGHGSLRASFMLALFGIAYLPIMSMLGYVVIPGKAEIDLFTSLATSEMSGDFWELASKIESRYWLHAVWYTIVFGAFAIFLIIRFVPATAYIHKVGKFRAFIICCIVVLSYIVAVFLVAGPISGRMFNLT
jgi:hypothetical protein